MKRRLVKKWYNYHRKLTLKQYSDYCHRRLYQYFPEMENWAFEYKKEWFTPIDWYKLKKYLWK